jgi:hypothetical protein
MIELGWTGWGTWSLSWSSGPRVLFDPCISSLLDEPHAAPGDLRADIIVVTHGHHEHLRDLCRVLRLVDAPVIAPEPVVHFLLRERHLPPRRLVVAEPGVPLDWPGVQLIPRAFPHLEKHDVPGKLNVLAGSGLLRTARIVARFAPRVLASWWVIRDQPEGGPYLAWDLRWSGGPRVFLTVEAFTEKLPDDLLDEWRPGPRPVDLLVVGVESGQERAAARQAERVGASICVAAPVHAGFERFYGRAPVDGRAFSSADGRRRWWPAPQRARFPCSLDTPAPGA